MSHRKVLHTDNPTADSAAVNGPIPPDLSAFHAPAAIPAVTADFDLDAFRADPGPIANPVESGVDAVRVDKPRKMEFVFIHPDWREYIWIIQGDFKRRRDAHLVLPAVAKGMTNICRRVLVVPYCADDGNYYLWPIPQEDPTGRINEYNKSAMRQVARAAGKWCQFEANLGNQTYNLYEAIVQREAPSWPPGGLNFLIHKAFEDRIVTAKDHPLFTQLRGRQI
jgi:hypothetical protein